MKERIIRVDGYRIPVSLDGAVMMAARKEEIPQKVVETCHRGVQIEGLLNGFRSA